MVEKAPAKVTGKEFYIPHRAVIHENAKSTRLRVVYDASARAYDGVPSLNECLHTGPPLQNELWNVIVRNRLHPVAVVVMFARDQEQLNLQLNTDGVLKYRGRNRFTCQILILLQRK